MPLLRSQIVQTVVQSDPGRDHCVNVVYHEVDDGFFDPGVGYTNHANEIRDLFAGLNPTSGATFQLYANRGLAVKVYDVADAKPRVPRATATHTPATWESAELAPRELACCLSFYGANPGIKTQRGRIYVGPFLVGAMAETVSLTIREYIVDLGHGLFDIGGENVRHVVHSPTKLTNTVVANYWANDLWDHMSSREERELARTVLAP